MVSIIQTYIQTDSILKNYNVYISNIKNWISFSNNKNKKKIEKINIKNVYYTYINTILNYFNIDIKKVLKYSNKYFIKNECSNKIDNLVINKTENIVKKEVIDNDMKSKIFYTLCGMFAEKMMNTAICSIMDNHIAIGIFIINNVQKYIEYNNIMLGGPLKIIYSFLVLYIESKK